MWINDQRTPAARDLRPDRRHTHHRHATTGSPATQNFEGSVVRSFSVLVFRSMVKCRVGAPLASFSMMAISGLTRAWYNAASVLSLLTLSPLSVSVAEVPCSACAISLY